MEKALSLEKDRPLGQPVTSVPLVVDLDGTLVKTDLMVESFFALIKQNPFLVFLCPFWLLKGRAFFKQQITRRVTLDVSVLPYHRELLDHLKAQHVRGRPLVLATANDERIARQVADHLQLFDRVLASNGTLNLSHRHKRERLIEVFGEKGFDYAGNARQDLEVWSSARKAIIVNSPQSVSRKAAGIAEIEQFFNDREGWLRPYIQALRLQQWIKNLLVFVPLVMAHRYNELDLLGEAFLAFLAFGLCASSVYLINDLTDLPADRHHPRKRQRPFASGELSLFWGLASIPLLLGLSVVVSLFLPLSFLGMLLLYYLLNLGYSFTLKRIVLLDVIVLAELYTMRIMAGSAAISIWPSPWLLAFSTFLFFSLALVKRYAELVIMRGVSGEKAQVRGYQVIDMELLASLGGGSGYVAVLVLAIYISSGAAEMLYTREVFLWLLCPLLLYWISYVWLIAHRGGMHDDPLVFTLRNRVSRIVILLVAAIFMLAR
jgi:4-hydroxybenzoate polyprenyltransferase/phosphoglycolate phosphatase-like HAD superfamily hydrolase